MMMMMIDLPHVYLTRLMMKPQVMQIMILPQAHLVMMMMVHARTIIMMLLQALHHHHIASCHKMTQVQNDNVVDHIDSYDELVSRLASMTMSLENDKDKTLKLENENSFSKELL